VAVKSEDVFRWVQIGFFGYVVLASYITTGPDGIRPRVKLYYHGMRMSQQATQKSRVVESWFMDKYFKEVNQ